VHADEDVVVVGNLGVVSCNFGTQYLIHGHMMSNQYHMHRHSGVQEPVDTSFSEGAGLGNVLSR
jgi:hypothetical protein